MIGIVILNYNNDSEIKNCINSIALYTNLSKVKLLIVDNGSLEAKHKNVKEFISEKFPSCQYMEQSGDECQLKAVNYLRLYKNLGYACGNNAGLELMYKDDEISHVLIVNSDILFTCDIVEPLLLKSSEIPNIGVISPILYKLNGEIDYCCARRNYNKKDLLLTFSIFLSRRYHERNAKNKILLTNPQLLSDELIEIELPSGSCMLFKKDVLKEIGGFDDNTFLYYEESILYKKLQAINKVNYLLPSVSCIHVGGATTTTTKQPYFLKKCNYESLMYYCKTYENFKCYQLLYIWITGHYWLFRLRLGRLYRKFLRHD